MALMELVQGVIPPGVLNVVTGFGAEAGDALAHSKGIAKLAFTGSTLTGTHVLKAAADSLIPTTLELGGKSPNVFFSSVCAQDDAFLDKAVEGAVLFALNQGEVCTCQSRLLVQEDIYEQFMERSDVPPDAEVGGPLHGLTALSSCRRLLSLRFLPLSLWCRPLLLGLWRAPRRSRWATLWTRPP